MLAAHILGKENVLARGNQGEFNFARCINKFSILISEYVLPLV